MVARVVMTKSEISKFKVLCVAAFSVAADSRQIFQPECRSVCAFLSSARSKTILAESRCHQSDKTQTRLGIPSELNH